MPIEILMPALSPTMEEGKLARWLIKEGDAVNPGDVLAEIETDKATMEVEAVDEGIVGSLLVAEGTEHIPVNQTIALLLQDGEDATAAVASPAPPPQETAAPASAAPAATDQVATPSPKTQPPAPSPAVTAAIAPNRSEQRIFASPLARRLAKDGNIDLSSLSGSGPNGRIIKRDITAALSADIGTAKPQTAAAATAVSTTKADAALLTVQAIPDDKILALYEEGSYDVIPHDGMRKIIAQRLTQSKLTIPHFYLTIDCQLDTLLAARGRLNARGKDDPRGAYKLSVNDFVIKALALALQQVPAANATWTEQGMLRHQRSDVGVAVAVEGGLFTPVIRHADLKTLAEISNEMKDLAERARTKRLAPHEYQGGTTSISNLGMFGIRRFDAVINPPHATILAVGAGEKRPIVVDDGIEIGTIMSCTLSCDHRVVDGAVGAEFLNAFKAYIEDPVRMLV